MNAKAFDLNIEKILENWEVRHAVREIIANALDEQILTNSERVQTSKEDNNWIIRDFGRGITYTHLTQNENEEKLNAQNVCHSEPRLTLNFINQVYFLTLHKVFYQHELSESNGSYKMLPIQLIFHVNRHHLYNRSFGETPVYPLNGKALLFRLI